MSAMRPVMLSVVAALALAGGSACKSENPAPAPKQVKKGVDTKRIPVPEHSPEKMSDPGEPLRRSTEGTFDVDIAGKREHFTFMPPGVNAAVYAEKTGVAWVGLKASKGPDGAAAIKIKLEHLRLDEVELPATFKTNGGKVDLEVRYELGPGKWWSAHSGKESDNAAEVTFESFEGKQLTGTFKGKLDPKSPDMGNPMEIAGEFAVMLRLSGVKPGTKAEKPS